MADALTVLEDIGRVEIELGKLVVIVTAHLGSLRATGHASSLNDAADLCLINLESELRKAVG